MNIYRVSFFGHRRLYEMQRINDRLDELICDLLCTREYVEFYVGRNGDFDLWAASAVKRAQAKLGTSNSTLNLILPYAMRDEEYYEQYYDNLVFPLSPNIHFKAAIGARNQWMAEHSDLVVACVEIATGGAYQAMQYAKQKGVPVINLSAFSDTAE